LHHYSIVDSGFLLLARLKSYAEISKDMTEISFNNMPEALAYLINKVERLETLLHSEDKSEQTESDKWLNLADLCDYHPDHPAKPTVYAWIGQRSIPYHKKGKKLMFLKSEIDSWLKEGRRKTAAEIQVEAEQFVTTNKKGGLR
jgi:excisionase family DNA binding protein